MTPLFIADFRSGLFTAKDEWIAPREAFPKLKNVRVTRGKIVRRDGFKIFGWFPERLESSGTSLTLTWADDGSDNVEVTTNANHGRTTGDAVIFQGVTGDGSSNLTNLKFFITVTGADTFILDNITWSGLHASPTPSGGTVDIIQSVSKVGEIADGGITAANPAAVESKSAHGLTTGNNVLTTSDFSNEITDPSGSYMESLDGTITDTSVLSTTTFTLNGVDTTDFGTHTSGGDIALVNDNNDNEIVGLGELLQDESNNIFLALNVKRMAKYDPTLTNFVAVEHNTLGYADVFTGDETEYFQISNAFSRVWITNFKDRPQTYDGTTFDHADFDIDNDATNEISRVRFIFQYNRRVVLLYAVEDGTKFAQRARWSRIDFGTGSTNEWDDQADDTNAGSLDADTDEEIIGAGFLKDQLIVFFERSIWSLEKTGSFDPPFRWRKIADNPGPFGAPFGVIGHGQFMWSVGQGGIVATDGFQIHRADESIPDFEDVLSKGSSDQADFVRVFAFKDVHNRQTWLAYPSKVNSPNDSVKVFDYENNTWTDYDIMMNVAGEYTGSVTARAWQNFNQFPDDTWENTNKRWTEFSSPRGDPKILFGNNQGIIYRMHDGTSDTGRNIESEIETMRFNPFQNQSVSAHLLYVDFIFTENSGVDFDVLMFSDFEDAPYKIEPLNLGNDSNRDPMGKIWKRIYINRIANTHKIKLVNQSTGEPYNHHGMILWFQPSGRFEFL